MTGLLSNFIYSVNVILPIFVLAFLGLFLKKIGLIGEGFAAGADKLVFKVGLPAMLFLEVARSSVSQSLNPRLVLFVFLSVTAGFLLVSGVVLLITKDNAKRGALIQGICRSNFAILGVPLIENMYGDAGLAEVALVMPVTILLFNIYSVIVLSVFAPKEKQLPAKQTVLHILKNIVTNPLIIGVVLGLPFMFFQIPLPVAASKTLQYLSNLVTPVALISLGTSFRREDLGGRIVYAIGASAAKTILMPTVMVTAAALLGFRGVALGIILVLFGAPTAVSSYIMAKNMDSDYELAGQILLLTTMMCLFTIFIGIFVLKTLSLI